ncbi:hypothetical protein A3L04_02705 [Thermococcus chitonophagus]|uniref:dolichyl-phosphooligosaccharide-protein glycotransferase n=1 Tax=Thermococcus chitonophagus TaxID=54262 RepID=A0A160VR97_9EURY|nr:STT3 domain-containing protein [Thermococcus chitonophagus]ASJ16066.1 hypothetical protein A3L04_02705 [Thermococcus chitonophagus]CUX77312.1 oligosaccharyl transferase [Thermococcus chitonophagus]
MKREKYLLIGILTLAIVLRLLPLRFNYMLGYDPYFHLKYIEYSLEKGQWINFFPYAFGPWGMQVHNYHPLGLWMTPGYLSKVLHISPEVAFKLTPLIFGILTLVFLWYGLRKMYNDKVALLGTFLLSVSFAHIMRSCANYYRGDNYMLFWYSLVFLGFSIMFERPKVAYPLILLSLSFSSIFWQAYYPIFVLALVNALMLSIWGFLYGDKTTIKKVAVLVAGTLGSAVLAGILGRYFGYGMFGYDRSLPRQFTIFKVKFLGDAFLTYYIFLALATVAVLAVMLLLKERMSFRMKVAFIGVLALVSLFVLGKFYSGLSTLFKALPISETQRPSIGDFWEAYGLQIFLIPLAVLKFRKPDKWDFLILGTAIALLPMAFIWTRFFFIASIALSMLLALGFSSLKLKKTVATAVVTLVLLASFLHGFYYTYHLKPEMSDNWERALDYLANHSNVNDVVMVWWDYGNWVTYYSTRAPVAQIGPSAFVAKYYLGLVGNRSLMGMGVDYVIVALNYIYKSKAIVETAGLNPKTSGYGLLILYPAGREGGYLRFYGDGVNVLVGKDFIMTVHGQPVLPREVFIEDKSGIKSFRVDQKSDLYVYVNLNYNYAIVTNAKTFNTPMIRLLFTNGTPGYKLVYSDGGIIKVYKFEHPNVAVKREGSKIVMAFSDPVGSKLVVEGFLDNGTMVYRKVFNVKGMEELSLPQDLNGSVVVRYAYIGKYVLDRGVFRIDDLKG